MSDTIKNENCFVTLPAEYYSNGIVQNTLAEYESVEINVHVQVVEYRDNCQRICGRYKSTEVQSIQKCE